MHDRLQNKSSGQYLREKGCYYLYCTQKLHGIPFLAPIAAAFVISMILYVAYYKMEEMKAFYAAMVPLVTEAAAMAMMVAAMVSGR